MIKSRGCAEQTARVPSCIRRMATLSVLLFAATALAQGTKYGENHVVTQYDSQVVEQRAFPAPNITLYSPAFAVNASFAPGWSDGSEGATSQADLGK